MPWNEVSTMSLRQEFVSLLQCPGANHRALCRRFGISAKTGYKWKARAEAAERQGQSVSQALEDQSRRPVSSPRRSLPRIEEEVVRLRRLHPAWGGRKLRQRLLVLGHDSVPSPSTITDILRRHNLISKEASQASLPWQRFEHIAPNQLWQMDFKGDFKLSGGNVRCYPLTVLDDHSRYAVGLQACSDQTGPTVQGQLTDIFRRHGLPERMTMDNGAPWGHVAGAHGGYTYFGAWLLRLGIIVSHSRPGHPQTQGKDERFHRTLGVELLSRSLWQELHECQEAFDTWRDVYNLERPHQALELMTPVQRFKPSDRLFPEVLPDVIGTYYGPEDIVRKVQQGGEIHFKGREWIISKAFRGQPVALRPNSYDGLWHVFYCKQRIAKFDLRDAC